MNHRIFRGILASLVAVVASATPRITTLSTVRQVLHSGQDLDLEVTATGVGPLSYQWKCSGRPVAGETGKRLLLTNTAPQDTGYYQVVVTDNTGSLSSAPVFVTIVPAMTQVVVWGSASDNLTAVPAGLNDAIALAVGSQHILALKADGTVIGWGRDYWGNAAIPAGLNNVVAIATNDFNSLALKADGTVVAWGRESDLPAGLNSIVAIAAGYHDSMALKADGTVVGWGGVDGGIFFPLPYAGIDRMRDVVALAPGSLHTLVLSADGLVTALPQGQQSPELKVPAGLTGVTAVAAGISYSLALKSDGTVVAWGDDAEGEINVPVGLEDAMAITSGGEHSLALKADGTVVAWGYNRNGQSTVPAELDKVFAVAAGFYNSAALRDASSGPGSIIITPANPTPTPPVTTAPTATPSAGGGGGGAPSAWFLATMGILALLRRMQRLASR